jgi:Queuosine biosynthesis protein QueC
MHYICGPSWDQRVVNIEEVGKVGIVMSGGIDSYVLYHLLTNPIIFNIKRKDGFDNAERVRRLTGKQVIEVEEVSDNYKNRIGDTMDKILADYNVDQLYMGINHTPPTYYFPEFDVQSKPHRPWRIYGDVKAPFLHLYKYHIIDLANSLDIDLSDTRSCIGTVSGPECTTCWQCREKRWGYDQLKH